MMPAREWAYGAAFLVGPYVPMALGAGFWCGAFAAFVIAAGVVYAFNAGKPDVSKP